MQDTACLTWLEKRFKLHKNVFRAPNSLTQLDSLNKHVRRDSIVDTQLLLGVELMTPVEACQQLVNYVTCL